MPPTLPILYYIITPVDAIAFTSERKRTRWLEEWGDENTVLAEGAVSPEVFAQVQEWDEELIKDVELER